MHWCFINQILDIKLTVNSFQFNLVWSDCSSSFWNLPFECVLTSMKKSYRLFVDVDTPTSLMLSNMWRWWHLTTLINKKADINRYKWKFPAAVWTATVKNFTELSFQIQIIYNVIAIIICNGICSSLGPI